MSDPILPFAVWQPGTNQNSLPANDNALREGILEGLVISDTTTAQPGSPAEGDVYIIPAGATGAQWALFDQYDLAIYDGVGTWHAYAPVVGVVVNLAGDLVEWSGAAYVPLIGAGDIAALIHAASSKATPVDADEIPISDSAASWGLKKLNWANLKATLGALFATIASPTFTGTPAAPTAASGTNTTQLATTAYVQAEVVALGLARVQVDVFPATGTWTKPTWAKFVFVDGQGAGAGGGSGRKGAAGSIRGGGGGGGGGGRSRMWFNASDLAATETVTVGAGGTGAPAQTANNSNGFNGNSGGSTTFGLHLVAPGGTASGTAGTATGSSTGGSGTGNVGVGGVGNSSSATGLVGNAGGNSVASAAGGASGGGITSGDAASAGGLGGRPTTVGTSPTQGAAGAIATAGGNGGTDPASHVGSGGGGGGSSTSGTNAGAGGNGGTGAGGGGGGAGLDGTNNSGAGGNGGDGWAVVVTYG